MTEPLVSADAPAGDRLAFAIKELALRTPDRPAIMMVAGTADRRVIDYHTLASTVEKLETLLDDRRPPGVIARAVGVESLAAIAAACGRLHVPVAFLAQDSCDLVGELRGWVTIEEVFSEKAEMRCGPHRDDDEIPTQVIVATSGTSGPPKLVHHSWDFVLAAARLAEQWHGLGWLLVYDATRWAGIQVWIQALLTGGTIVVPASRDPDVIAQALVAGQVAVLPATPTLLRRLVTSADKSVLDRANPVRITLGGEAADSVLLERTKEAFPRAKITQVYATTELGEVFRVADARPGFPAAWLGKSLPGGVRLTTRRDGELLVQLSRDTAEVGTGDLIERRGDRFEFTGRRSDVIIVGGAKVFPGRVEEILRRVPGVAEARVYGIPSAVTGELVAAEIVLAESLPGTATPDHVRAAALAACRGSLESYGVPRVLDIVKQITMTAAGKTARRTASTLPG